MIFLLNGIGYKTQLLHIM